MMPASEHRARRAIDSLFDGSASGPDALDDETDPDALETP